MIKNPLSFITFQKMIKNFILGILLFCFVTSGYSRKKKECYCFNSLKLKIDGFTGINGLNVTTLENGKNAQGLGVIAGAGAYLYNFFPNKKIIPRVDFFLNYRVIDNDRFRQTVLAYNLSFLFGYRLYQNLEGYIGPNLISGFSSKYPILPSLQTKLNLKIKSIHVSIGSLFILGNYSVNSLLQSYSHSTEFSYILSTTLSFPIFKRIYYDIRR